MTMRNLVVTENITLDGVIDASEGWFAPSGDDGDNDTADMAQVQQEHMNDADAVLLGRVTYEQFQGYWPLQTDDTTGISDYLNRTDKYVVSATLPAPTWQNTTALEGPLAAEVATLKERPGKAIVATGSVSLVQALLPTGLVDEYRLFVYPVVLGRGRRLFEDATDLGALRLVEARPFPSGVVLMRYRAA
jgi:dihydrofolate reductase